MAADDEVFESAGDQLFCVLRFEGREIGANGDADVPVGCVADHVVDVGVQHGLARAVEIQPKGCWSEKVDDLLEGLEIHLSKAPSVVFDLGPISIKTERAALVADIGGLDFQDVRKTAHPVLRPDAGPLHSHDVDELAWRHVPHGREGVATQYFEVGEGGAGGGEYEIEDSHGWETLHRSRGPSKSQKSA